MEKITANVYVENKISWCNSSCVVTKEGVVIIDTPMVPAYAKQHAAEVGKFGEVRYVINTEPHGDHISGDCYFGGALVTHEGTRDAILASKVEDFKVMLQRTTPDIEVDKDFKYRPPDITLNDRMTLYLGDHTFHLMHMPGHTPFQVVVYVPEERTIFTSDNVTRVIPFFHQCVPDAWLKTLKQLEKLDVDYVVPGHGDVGDKNCIKEMQNTVNTWLNTIKDAIAKGMTKEEAQNTITMEKEFPNLPRDERNIGVIKMNVTRLYEILTKQGG
ncbi:MAG: MBL fold metallo-hydrolase [Dehalococcoidales bacterium]|nr:MBL fold metallo-hydrolase [Dehalococcoidales bacterium]